MSSVFNNGGGVIKATPLIDFGVLIDEDLSLASYIISEVRNHEVFDLEKIQNMTKIELITNLYLRDYKNPLYLFMKDEKYKDFLDKCYEEFMENGEFLYYYAIQTQFFTVLKEYIQSSEITSTILYHNDMQLMVIEKDPVLSKVSHTKFEDIDNIEFFSQFYFRYIDDAERFNLPRLNRRSYYFSTSGPNIDSNKEKIIDSELLNSIGENVNQINLFDLYPAEIIGKAIN